ncbi:hypothetical protein M1373_03530 [Candidatus Marsarchaeota archaeon]|nr:hypothetical protein [Candidatus Marsarchaeota archaeon]MCL5404817.1 hypothetical protein [Candidatus Marsarchaeota archaeon]
MKFEEIAKRTKALGFHIGEYALFGSVPLAAHGIRESQDIDVLVTHEVYQRLKSQGWEVEVFPNGREMLKKGCFEVGENWDYGVYNPNPARLIKEADIIEGIPVVRLEEALAWKKVFGREKDKNDVKLINKFLKNKPA